MAAWPRLNLVGHAVHSHWTFVQCASPRANYPPPDQHGPSDGGGGSRTCLHGERSQEAHDIPPQLTVAEPRFQPVNVHTNLHSLPATPSPWAPELRISGFLRSARAGESTVAVVIPQQRASGPPLVCRAPREPSFISLDTTQTSCTHPSDLPWIRNFRHKVADALSPRWPKRADRICRCGEAAVRMACGGCGAPQRLPGAMCSQDVPDLRKKRSGGHRRSSQRTDPGTRGDHGV